MSSSSMRDAMANQCQYQTYTLPIAVAWSEWRLHRTWFEQSALADLLGGDFSLAEIHKLYRCLDRVVAHKKALFSHLRQKWADLFGAKFEVLLYDLTSTYFESEPPFPEGDKRRYGYSRDKRSDCVQVVIASS